MQKNNFKYKLSRQKVEALYTIVSKTLEFPPQTMSDRLNHALLIGVHKKLLLLWTYRAELSQSKITLSPEQAIAFWLTFNPDKTNSSVHVYILSDILDSIHKQYA